MANTEIANATEGKDIIKTIPIINVADIKRSEELYEAYKYANIELVQAESNFNNADPEFIDIAILELQAKKLKRDLLYRQYSESKQKTIN